MGTGYLSEVVRKDHESALRQPSTAVACKLRFHDSNRWPIKLQALA
jgi:hypothetical protein